MKKVRPGYTVKTNKYSHLIGLAVVILLGIIIYSNSFTCSFHFDDFSNIVDNTKIHNLADVNAWWNFVPSRPVGSFTFALNYHFNQLDVRYYHLTNLLIHLINACLVWWLTLLILSSPGLKDQNLVKNKRIIALVTALLFVSHPLATQSVTYIVQRLASLVTLFYLLSLTLYMKARLTGKNNRSPYFLFAGSLIAAVLAMLTKENAFTLPFAILLAEIFFLRTKKLSVNLRDWKVILGIAAFLGLVIVIPLKFTFSIFDSIPPTQGHPYTVTALNYLLTEFSVIVKYIQLFFLPIHQMLEYNFPISDNFFEIRTLTCFLLLLSLAILAIFLFKKHRIISFGIFWFFLTISIESSVVPLPNVIFEHRTYLPSFGFFLIVSSCIFGFLWDKYKILSLVFMVIMVISYSYLTFERNKVWKDNITLWTDNVEKAPDIPRPVFSLGVAYWNIGERDKAIATYSRTIEIDPSYVTAWYNRGVAYGQTGQPEKAIIDFSRTIELDPKNAKAWSNRGTSYSILGKWDNAIADFSKAIELLPNYSIAWFNRGIAYGNQGEWEKAIADFSKTLELDPGNRDAFNDMKIAKERLSRKK